MGSVDITYCVGSTKDFRECKKKESCFRFLLTNKIKTSLNKSVKEFPVSMMNAPDDVDDCGFYYKVQKEWGLS